MDDPGIRGLARVAALIAALVGFAGRPEHVLAACSVADLCPGTASACTISGIRDVDADCSLDFGARDVTVTGTLRAAVSGGWFQISAASLTLAGGKLRSNGSLTDSLGGDIVVDVTGAFRMIQSGAAINVDGSGGGGTISISAGSIEIASGAPAISANGTGARADGGGITLEAAGPLTVGGVLQATGGSNDSDGGTIELSGTSVAVSKAISVVGVGFSSSISIAASPGGITLTSGGTLDAHATSYSEGGDTYAGSGGAISLAADAAIVLDGAILADGAAPDGSGGEIDVFSWHGGVTTTNVITAEGNGSAASGGRISLEAGAALQVGGNLLASATGIEGSGGTIDLSAGGGMTLAAGRSLRATGGWSGGGVTTSGTGALAANGTIDVSGGDGGTIDLGQHCTATVAGSLNANASPLGSSGWITVTAYTVTLAGSARVESNPCAAPLPGLSTCTQLVVRQGVAVLTGGAIVLPPPALATNPTLDACCGNGTFEPGETCDDGNRLHCDGCSPACTLEPSPACPSDGNDCTSDCSPTLGCVVQPLTGTACSDDGNLCTTDLCAAGVCNHQLRSCDDGIACTIDGACDPSTGACSRTTDDSRCEDGSPCTSDTCDVALGCRSTNLPDGASCSDADACTTRDTCLGGACRSLGPPLNCDDGDACTSDTCHPLLACVHGELAAQCGCTSPQGPLAAGTPCADGNPCSSGDSCDGAGTCVAGPSCDDGDPCTRDSCLAGVCVHDDDVCPSSCVGAPDGSACSDGLSCTAQSCQGGACVAAPLDCGGADVCDATGLCVEGIGCRAIAPPVADPFCSNPFGAPFLCYRAALAAGSTALPAPANVTLTDAFGSTRVDVKKPVAFCAPASNDGLHPDAPLAKGHFAGLRLSNAQGAPSFAPRIGLEVSDAFGTQKIDVVARERLFHPATVGTFPTPPDLDRFDCYRVSPSKGSPRFPPRDGVPVDDRFGRLTLDLTRPSHLCRPADLAGSDPGAPGHTGNLVCYRVKVSTGTARFAKQSVTVDSTGASATLTVSKPDELCLPATVTAAP